MTSVSRRDLAPSPPAVSPESPDEAKAASAVKGGKVASGGSPSKTAGSGTQGNHLEAYSGPPRQAEQTRSRAQSAGEGGLTAGQLALMGARADTVRLGAVYDDIKSSLTTGWKDWAVTDGEVRRIHSQLETLPSADYRKMMGQLEREGLLGRYLEQAEPEARKDFLAQAERKGYVSTRPAEKAAPAPGMPPEGAVFFVPDSRLPDSVRELLHAANRTAANNYFAAYDAYLGRFRQEVSQAQSVSDLRALGAPVDRLDVSHQLSSSHPDYDEAHAKWARSMRYPKTVALTYKAIEDRKRDLTGEMRAGTFRFKHEGEVKADIGDTSLKLAREDGLTQSGKGETTYKTGGEATGHGLKVGGGVDSAGEKKQTIGAETPLFAIELDSEGATKLELRAGSLAKVYTEFNPEKGRFGGGVSFEKEVSEKLGVKSEVGFEWQGAKRGRAGEALHGSGLFEKRPEPVQDTAPPSPK